MPDTGNEALDAITRRQNLAIDSTVAWFVRMLRDILTRSQLRTAAELQKRLQLENGSIARTAANQKTLRQTEALFVQAMERSGYGELVDELVGSFGGQFAFFEETLQVLGEKPVRFTAAEQNLFTAQQESVADTLHGIVRNAAEMAKQRALLSVGGLGPAELAEVIGRQTGKTLSQAATVADTAQSTFYRTIAEKGFARIEADQPKKQPLRYRFYGPDDALNRPFCRKLIEAQEKQGKSYTRAEIEAMDNGQLPNVFLTGGGYRCRHQWIVAKAVPAGVREEAEQAAEAAKDPDAVVRVGRIDRGVTRAFGVRNTDQTVVLTQERLDHFSGRTEFQPRQVIQAVLDPEFVYRDRKNADTGLFYKRLDDGHVLKVAVRFQPRKGRLRHSILTAHVERDRAFRRLPRRYLVWQRQGGQ